MVTNHDAFGYYIDRYGLEFVGSIIPSFDTSTELSGRDIRDLVAKIKATGVKAIFSETSLPPRTAETIGREAGVKVVTGEDALYGDALGPPGSDGDALRVAIHGDQVPRAPDTWLEVEGRWQQRTSDDPDRPSSETPLLVAESVRETEQPSEPYESGFPS